MACAQVIGTTTGAWARSLPLCTVLSTAAPVEAAAVATAAVVVVGVRRIVV